MTEAEALQTPGDLRRHKKGGIYKLLEVTTIRQSQITWAGNEEYDRREVINGKLVQTLLVTYQHIWPHEQQLFQRPYLEFQEAGRFMPIIGLHDKLN